MRPKGKSKSTLLSPESQKAKKQAQKQAKASKESVKIHMLYARSDFQKGDLENAHMQAGWACEKLKADDLDTEPIEFLGEIKIELGDLDGARDCFLQAVARKEKGSREILEFGDEAKYLWLGQLSTAEEAVAWYMKGADVLVNVLNKYEGEAVLHIKRKLSTTYCSLVELYLTDLWYTSSLSELTVA